MSLRPLSELYPRNHITGWHDVSPFFGATFHDLNGTVIKRGVPPPGDNLRLPAVLDNYQSVTGELIPSTSWGASLANLLIKRSWDAIRKPIIEANSHVCELCGAKPDAMDVHEIWEYHYPDHKDVVIAEEQEMMVFGRQELKGFMSVCHGCHECFHLGFANSRGRLQTVMHRLQRLNGWSIRQTEGYLDEVMERFVYASRINWMLDFAGLKLDGQEEITLKRRWSELDEDPRLITAEAPMGGQLITAILGVPWLIHGEKEVRKPQRFEDIG